MEVTFQGKSTEITVKIFLLSDFSLLFFLRSFFSPYFLVFSI